jgi:hypothetical protein
MLVGSYKPGSQGDQTFMVVIFCTAISSSVYINLSHFHPSLIFVGMVRTKEPTLKGLHPSLATRMYVNISHYCPRIIITGKVRLGQLSHFHPSLVFMGKVRSLPFRYCARVGTILVHSV